MVGPSIIQEKVAIEKPLAAAVRMTCYPKLNVVAATGASDRLSDDAVVVSEPQPGQGAALAEPAARVLSKIVAGRKKRNAPMSFPRLFAKTSPYVLRRPLPVRESRATAPRPAPRRVRPAGCGSSSPLFPVRR